MVREELGSDVAQLQTLRVAPDPDIRVETTADLPTSQASPQADAEHRRRHHRRADARDRRRLRRQILDPRLRREAQLRRLYRLPILARIPKETAERRATLRSGPRRISPRRRRGLPDPAIDPRRAAADGDEGSRVILVTGPSPSEGKSTTAINLASSLALSGKRVILIEADLRRPVARAGAGRPARRRAASSAC